MAAEKSVLLPVSADEAFALLTEPDRLRRWKTISARVDLRAGGAYRWTIVPGHAAAGTFREIEPGRRIVFGWGWEGSPDLAPDASTVTVTLEPVEGGTLVRLVHEGLTPEQEASHLAGWTHFFARLERAATAGDAGPDEWAASPPDLDPLVSADATLAVCQHVLRGISPDDLARPTPCEDLTVAELADHLIGSLTDLGRSAGGTVRPAAVGSVESRVAVVGQQAIEAWVSRGLAGAVRLPSGGEAPAAVVVGALSTELLVHAWDFAAALGRQVPVSDDVTGYVLELAQRAVAQSATQHVKEGGSAADARAVGPDARTLERLIEFSGRTAA